MPTPDVPAERVLADLLTAARARLAGVPQQALAAWRQPRSVLGIRRAPRLVPVGAAWHLGVLLLADDALLATGEIVRAREPAPRGYTAQAQRERAALAEAAFRGGFAAGTSVHVGWRRLELGDAPGASGPVRVRGGQWEVRWSRSGGFVALSTYLEERTALLRNPPPGTT